MESASACGRKALSSAVWSGGRRPTAPLFRRDRDGSIEPMVALCSRRPRHLASDTPAGQRRWAGRRYRASPRVAGRTLGGQVDGLLQLPQPVDRRTSGIVCLAQAGRVAFQLARVVGCCLPARTITRRAHCYRTRFPTRRRRSSSCAVERNARRFGWRHQPRGEFPARQ